MPPRNRSVAQLAIEEGIRERFWGRAKFSLRGGKKITSDWGENQNMGIFQAVLILSTFLCSLVAGFLFAFSVVVMPGIKSLNDRAFIRAFQVMDRVIQNNQPIFMLVWVGSVVVLIASDVLGVGQLDGINRFLLLFTALAYLLGIQLPTITINVPFTTVQF
jgi:uncharacterized membrane protein